MWKSNTKMVCSYFSCHVCHCENALSITRALGIVRIAKPRPFSTLTSILIK